MLFRTHTRLRVTIYPIEVVSGNIESKKGEVGAKANSLHRRIAKTGSKSTVNKIPATLVVGFTTQRSIFRCCPIPLPNFKISRFSLHLCIQCCDRPGRECPELEYRGGQVVLMSWCSSVCFVAIFPQLAS